MRGIFCSLLLIVACDVIVAAPYTNGTVEHDREKHNEAGYGMTFVSPHKHVFTRSLTSSAIVPVISLDLQSETGRTLRYAGKILSQLNTGKFLSLKNNIRHDKAIPKDIDKYEKEAVTADLRDVITGAAKYIKNNPSFNTYLNSKEYDLIKQYRAMTNAGDKIAIKGDRRLEAVPSSSPNPWAESVRGQNTYENEDVGKETPIEIVKDHIGQNIYGKGDMGKERPIEFIKEHVGFGPITVEAKTFDAPPDTQIGDE